MKLLCTLTSPYARKVRVLARERGLDLPLQITDPHAGDAQLIAASPTGKVPVLLLDDGQAVYDSRVISDYLEIQVGRSLPPLAEMVRAALAESILDAAVTLVMERRRDPSEQSPAAVERQFARIRRVVDRFNELPPPEPADPISLEQIGVAVSLAYLDFRLPDSEWRRGRSALADWFELVADRPSMTATTPPSA